MSDVPGSPSSSPVDATLEDRYFERFWELHPRVLAASATTALAIVFAVAQIDKATVTGSGWLKAALVVGATSLPIALATFILPMPTTPRWQLGYAVLFALVALGPLTGVGLLTYYYAMWIGYVFSLTTLAALVAVSVGSRTRRRPRVIVIDHRDD